MTESETIDNSGIVDGSGAVDDTGGQPHIPRDDPPPCVTHPTITITTSDQPNMTVEQQSKVVQAKNPILDFSDRIAEIRAIELDLKNKKHALYVDRLKKIHNNPLIDDIRIEILANDNWCINYSHTTTRYSQDLYTYQESMEQESMDRVRTDGKRITHSVCFGKCHNGYYISGTSGEFDIYRNPDGVIRIIPLEYNKKLEYDFEKYSKIIRGYIKNIHVPESLALAIFMHMSLHKWTDSGICYHLNCV